MAGKENSSGSMHTRPIRRRSPPLVDALSAGDIKIVRLTDQRQASIHRVDDLLPIAVAVAEREHVHTAFEEF